MSVAPASGDEDKSAAAAPGATVVIAAPVTPWGIGDDPVVPPADLMAIDGVFVKQEIVLLEVVTGFETQNKYKVRDHSQYFPH